MRRFVTILRDTVDAFLRDDVSLLGAAMVYYALLSLGPLLLLLLAGLGFALSFLPAGIDARQHLLNLANTHLGAQFSTTLEPILDSVGHYGSMGAFRHLRKSFRRIWRPDQPDPLPIRRVLLHEVVDFLAAFGLVLAVGALMLLSTVATGIRAMIQAEILQMPIVGGWLSLLISPLTAFVVSFLVFCALYRFLPPAKVRWRDVWLGGLLAALLWEALKRLLAFYLAEFAVGSAFGLVGTVLVLTIWVYATCLVVFLGAEFCKVWTHRNRKASKVM
jgi:membrane protein